MTYVSDSSPYCDRIADGNLTETIYFGWWSRSILAGVICKVPSRGTMQQGSSHQDSKRKQGMGLDMKQGKAIILRGSAPAVVHVH